MQIWSLAHDAPVRSAPIVMYLFRPPTPLPATILYARNNPGLGSLQIIGLALELGET